MKLTKTATYERTEVIGFECDICKKNYMDIFELQEALQYINYCGYGSVFGDGFVASMDICQHCLKEKFGEFIKVETEDKSTATLSKGG